jgi:putative endonuclease
VRDGCVTYPKLRRPEPVEGLPLFLDTSAMTFWVYMLHCNGGAIYTGETDNLDRLVAQHESGALPGFTHDRRPVTLVWSENFQTRLEAKTVEQEIKGWSKAKKLALIRGDWTLVSALSQNSIEKEKAALRQAQGDGFETRNERSDLRQLT